MLESDITEVAWREGLKDVVQKLSEDRQEYRGDLPFPEFVYIQRATSWNDFLDWRRLLEARGQYGFRGQRDAKWNLASSLDRMLFLSGGDKWGTWATQRNPLEYEPELLFEYQQQAHQYVNNLPAEDDLLSWLAIMQHHGTPTRLVDWTRSSHVAAYFAVEEPFDTSAIWAIDLAWLDTRGSELLQRSFPALEADRVTFINALLRKGDSTDQPGMVVRAEPKRADAWMSNQRGFFLVKNWTASSMNQLLVNMIIRPILTDGPVIQKLEIRGALRFEFLRNLHDLNIHRGSLFPDLDGFSRSLRNKLEIRLNDLQRKWEEQSLHLENALQARRARRR